MNEQKVRAEIEKVLEQYKKTTTELRPLTAFERLAAHDTLRRAAIEGRLRAVKLGRDWLTTEQDVRSYLRSRWRRRFGLDQPAPVEQDVRQYLKARYHVGKRDEGWKPFFIRETSPNYSEIPVGFIHEMPFDEFVKRHDLEIVARDSRTATVRAEWGNGEGYDTFAVEFSPEPDDESEALEK